jgi:hypothetical protein
MEEADNSCNHVTENTRGLRHVYIESIPNVTLLSVSSEGSLKLFLLGAFAKLGKSYC